MDDVFEDFEIAFSDDEEEIMGAIEMPRNPRKFRDRPNHFEEWNDREFLDRFRISKESAMQLLHHIHDIIAHPTNWNHALNSGQQLLIALRFYASGNMEIAVGDFGGVHKSTACRIIRNVTRAIASLGRQYITLPSEEISIRDTQAKFYKIARFPRVIGAINCTHIRVQCPVLEQGEVYRNRKGYFSINVQSVADPQLRFSNIVARWPGSAHDSRIFNNCRLKTELEEGVYKNSFLVGDSGYALKQYLMTPVRNPTTRAENLYNESHIRTRNIVERKYGVWKRRFPILSLGIRLKLDNALALIVATAVLHNIAIDQNDDEPAKIQQIDMDEVDVIDAEDDNSGNLVRQNLINEYFALL